ncbi:hypothetical protein [Gryllotalpicola protaetiae]|uniref:Uncharacterized protein n=1 Tax=Gryllotalpicola protaetiae TaxID=2419771 RepID=A0A387BN20_9MICO|nr:hypothetical protein [Gryllotalpicola protaetiae]AYG02387.1 hypothetical protein D7I44_01780 [Gryllotalpicola protaetiae]
MSTSRFVYEVQCYIASAAGEVSGMRRRFLTSTGAHHWARGALERGYANPVTVSRSAPIGPGPILYELTADEP